MRLQAIRKELGLTQAKLADSLGITPSLYVGYESGRRPLASKHILTFQSVFNVNPVWLQEGQGEMFIGGVAPTREANEGQRILFAKVGERLGKLRAALKLTAAELAQVVGATEADVTAAEKGEKKLTGAQTAKLKNAYPTVNGQWLEHGSGAMFLEAEAPKNDGHKVRVEEELGEPKGFFYSALKPLLERIEVELIKKDDFKQTVIKVFDIDAHCGLFEYVDVDTEVHYVTVPLPHNVKAEIGFRIAGDSMRPRLKPGSFIYCKEIKDYDYISAGDDYIYVVHFKNYISVKFIKRNLLSTDGVIELDSANPSYPALTVKVEDIRHIWRVVATIDYTP